MSGFAINLSTLNEKLQKRLDVLNPSLLGNKNLLSDIILPAIQYMGDVAKPAVSYCGVVKNAYIFDLGLIGRYFTDATPAKDYEGATHLLVIEGAHTQTTTRGTDSYKENEPTVILAPVRKISEESYKMVGDPADAASEWPVTHSVRKNDLNPVDITSQNSTDENTLGDKAGLASELIFTITPAESVLPDASAARQNEHTTDENNALIEDTAKDFSGILLKRSEALSVKDALPYLRNITKIKTRFSGIIEQAIMNSTATADEKTEAVRYYTGFAEGFVFEKKSIELVYEQMTTDKHSLVLFEGARLDPQSSPTHYGKPTLLGFVYEEQDSGEMWRAAQNPDAKLGIEYPPVLRITNIHKGIPELITPEEILPKK